MHCAMTKACKMAGEKEATQWLVSGRPLTYFYVIADV